MAGKEAVFFLIDNSAASINGDYGPTRLRAQETATERLIRYMKKGNVESIFGIGTLSSSDIGVVASLTADQSKLFHAMDTIQPMGDINLSLGLKKALLALGKRKAGYPTCRIIAFVGSFYTLSDEDLGELADSANSENVSIDVVAFGDALIDSTSLENLVGLVSSTSYFVPVPPNSGILSDAVLSSPIGPGTSSTMQLNDDDPDLAIAIQQSMETDQQLQEAIAASMADQEILEDDPEILEAIRESLMDGEQLDQELGIGEKPDLDDPELIAGIQEALLEASKPTSPTKHVKDPELVQSLADELPDDDPDDPRPKRNNHRK